MTKMKTTKKSVFASAISLLLCFVMLLGTTYAWFTDTVTSAGNKIQSGTLVMDLELYDVENDKWNSIKESKTPIFNYEKWEPGRTEVQLLKVENEGNLALKWMAKFVSASELSVLADVIDVYVLPYGVQADASNVTYPENRSLEGYTKVGTVAEFVNTIETTTVGELKAGESAYLGIGLKMQESAGNEYQNLDLGGAFDIQVLATQLTYETDNFDNQYDKDSEYPATVTTEIPENSPEKKLIVGDVSVTVPANSAPGKYELVVTNYNKKTVEEKTTVSYDISLLKDGVKTSGVMYPVEIVIGKGLSVESVNHNGTSIDSYTYQNGIVSFETDSFSPFSITYTKLADKWDGTADTSWYNEADTEFVLDSAEQFAGFAKLVDAGNTFEGKTIKLSADLDLYSEDASGERVSFDPIGYGYNVVFKGIFDGNDKTISNLYQNGWALGLDYSTEGGGLFASVVDATIKNLTVDKAEIVMECIDMGTIVGYSYGDCTYQNITVKNSTIANYNRYTGGVVGEVNGKQTFKNVDVIDTTVSALWGTYDASLGGIVGGKWGEAELTFEDCDVSAKLDAFNDACSNYQYYNYRLCGMLIGMSEEVTDGTATASYLTCTNCTVTYGDWANYTYCEFEANGQGSYNAPDEWKFSRVQEGYATEGVDPNHTHDTDESHEELLEFDQLFGGDKGVKGGKIHDGVTVIYNNK